MKAKEQAAAPDGNGAVEFTVECPGRAVFNHIASRWGLLVLVTLSQGSLRFHLLRDRIDGISEKMLSQTLKSLVRDGLITRRVERTMPPHVAYELTAIGGELAAPLQEVITRLGRRIPDIIAAQLAYDDHSPVSTTETQQRVVR
jgi:DNA-binding HxlR family transcriptional regulator